MPLNRTLKKMAKMVNLVCEFYHSENELITIHHHTKKKKKKKRIWDPFTSVGSKVETVGGRGV